MDNKTSKQFIKLNFWLLFSFSFLFCFLAKANQKKRVKKVRLELLPTQNRATLPL